MISAIQAAGTSIFLAIFAYLFYKWIKSLYEPKDISQMLDEMQVKMGRWNGEHQMILRRFVADADLIELDSNGRILLNKRKKEDANIKQDVRFLAVDDKIEIWDKTLYEDMLGISGEQNDNLGLDLQNLMTDLQ